MGEYSAPPCPPLQLLQEILETAYIASTWPEEGRFPKFLLAVYPSDGAKEILRFSSQRDFSAAELRRVIPSTDFKKSAIVVEWETSPPGLKIVGLQDLGTSWFRARMALSYDFAAPNCLVIEVPRPGHMSVFQREYRIGTLADGVAQVSGLGERMHLSLHGVADSAIYDLNALLVRPKKDGEWRSFESMAMWNAYSAIANIVSMAGHGGSLVLLPSATDRALEALRIKYRCDAVLLRDAFVNFINARHRFCDAAVAVEVEGAGSETLNGPRHDVDRSFEKLVEATRFTAQLANCDGALVLARNLTIVGFGVEIRAVQSSSPIFEVKTEIPESRVSLDLESFGMRHRSAINLVSCNPGVRVLAVSQDGPISAVWSSNGDIFVRKGVNLTAAHLPQSM